MILFHVKLKIVLTIKVLLANGTFVSSLLISSLMPKLPEVLNHLLVLEIIHGTRHVTHHLNFICLKDRLNF